MKNKIIAVSCVFLFILSVFLISLIFKNKKTDSDNNFQSKNSYTQKELLYKDRTLLAYDKTTNEKTQIYAKDYILNVICENLNENAENEAVKALGVAIYTNLLKEKELNKNNDYDICLDNAKNYTYDNFLNKTDETTAKRFEELLLNVFSLTIVKDKKLIDALYFPISSGSTNIYIPKDDSATLYPAASPWDKFANGYISKIRMTEEEIKLLLPGVIPKSNSVRFSEINANENGTVLSLSVNGTSFTGKEIMTAFSLPSSAFTIKKEDGIFIFTCMGKGCNTGMSLYGANFLAKEGKSFKEILYHYYGDCELV